MKFEQAVAVLCNLYPWLRQKHLLFPQCHSQSELWFLPQFGLWPGLGAIPKCYLGVILFHSDALVSY